MFKKVLPIVVLLLAMVAAPAAAQGGTPGPPPATPTATLTGLPLATPTPTPTPAPEPEIWFGFFAKLTPGQGIEWSEKIRVDVAGIYLLKVCQTYGAEIWVTLWFYGGRPVPGHTVIFGSPHPFCLEPGEYQARIIYQGSGMARISLGGDESCPQPTPPTPTATLPPQNERCWLPLVFK